MKPRSAQLLYFGAPDVPLFGRWHAAKDATGMVRCRPLGREFDAMPLRRRHICRR